MSDDNTQQVASNSQAQKGVVGTQETVGEAIIGRVKNKFQPGGLEGKALQATQAVAAAFASREPSTGKEYFSFIKFLLPHEDIFIEQRQQLTNKKLCVNTS